MTSSNVRRTLAAIAGITVVASSFTAPPAAAQSKELIYNIFIPKRAPVVSRGLMPWAKQVEKASNGAVKITIPTATLAPPPRQFDIVQDGVADIALSANFWRAKQFHMPLITNIPFLAPTAAAASQATWATHKKHFEKVNEFKNFVVLTQFALTEGHLQSRTIPIKSLGDFKNLKFHSAPGISVQIMKALGATVVPGPNVKAFELVNTGVVEASLIGFGPGNVLGLKDKVKHVTEFSGGFGRTSFSLIMNKDSFNGLPAAARNALISTSGLALSAKVGALGDAIAKRGRANYVKKKVNIMQPSPAFEAAAKKAVAFVEEDWIKKADAKGVNGREALGFYRNAVATAKPVMLPKPKGKKK